MSDHHGDTLLSQSTDQTKHIADTIERGIGYETVALCHRLRVVQIPSVVRMVGFGGLPTALPDTEMEIMRSGLSQTLRAVPHPFLTIGRRVRITRGPFAGLEGILVRSQKRTRFVISLDLILRSVAVEVDAADLEPVWLGKILPQ